ncbi:MAG: hypothetical protein COB93_02410 [Sneathiella sp.]|nr:MAG: hypothetical protein COB93_02410 [Sneathiella sp.]
MEDKTPISVDEIDKHRTEKGGWTRLTAAKWGVPWPLPKGWRKALIKNGVPYCPVGLKPSEYEPSGGFAETEARNKAIFSLQAFVGVWGVKTHQHGTGSEFLNACCKVFEVENTGCPISIREQVAGISKGQRKRLAVKNIKFYFGSEGRVRNGKIMTQKNFNSL